MFTFFKATANAPLFNEVRTTVIFIRFMKTKEKPSRHARKRNTSFATCKVPEQNIFSRRKLTTFKNLKDLAEIDLN
jgi:hypothetical protein